MSVCRVNCKVAQPLTCRGHILPLKMFTISAHSVLGRSEMTQLKRNDLVQETNNVPPAGTCFFVLQCYAWCFSVTKIRILHLSGGKLVSVRLGC